MQETKYNIGDIVVVKPPHPYNEAHSVFTIKSVMVELEDGSIPRILYGMKESRWMINEDDVLRKVKL